jgi:hypothetical protein
VNRIDIVQAVRGVIVANLPDGFEEVRHYAGLDCWAVPKEMTPRERGSSPLTVMGLGERKTYVSLFVMGLYFDPSKRHAFDRAWKASGCPLRRGKVSVQLRDLDDVPLDVIADAAAWFTPEQLVDAYERDRAGV